LIQNVIKATADLADLKFLLTNEENLITYYISYVCTGIFYLWRF